MSLIDIPLVLIGLVFVVVAIRMVIGPSQADRAVAADLSFFCFICMVALFGARQGLSAAFDVVMIATLTGLIATLWLARLIRPEQDSEQQDSQPREPHQQDAEQRNQEPEPREEGAP